MICPVCKSDMIVVEYRGIELDYCSGCKGVWFDSGEVELLLESHGFEGTKAFLDGILRGQDTVASEKKRNCPICGHKMRKAEIGQQPGILIDVCRHEHGLWFDGGEVTQLMRHLARKHTPAGDAGEQVIGFLEEVFQASKEAEIED